MGGVHSEGPTGIQIAVSNQWEMPMRFLSGGTPAPGRARAVAIKFVVANCGTAAAVLALGRLERR